MRKVTFGVANSLDNYIARSDGAVDWLMWSDEVYAFITEFWKRVDTVLMGRKTYEAGVRESKGNPNPYPDMKTYVCSRTLKPKRGDPFEFTNDAVKLIRGLKRKRGKEICVLGGGELARSLFEAQVIDEVGVSIHPVLLGSGIPLFHEMREQIDLRLLESRTFKNGCVLLSYSVKH